MTVQITPTDRESFLRTISDTTEHLIALSGVAEMNINKFGSQTGFVEPDTIRTIRILYELLALKNFLELECK